MAVLRRIAKWLGIAMGVVLLRGVFVGRRVYEVGHYTTASRAQLSAIFAEADAALGSTARRGARLSSSRVDDIVNT